MSERRLLFAHTGRTWSSPPVSAGTARGTRDPGPREVWARGPGWTVWAGTGRDSTHTPAGRRICKRPRPSRWKQGAREGGEGHILSMAPCFSGRLLLLLKPVFLWQHSRWCINNSKELRRAECTRSSTLCVFTFILEMRLNFLLLNGRQAVPGWRAADYRKWHTLTWKPLHAGFSLQEKLDSDN